MKKIKLITLISMYALTITIESIIKFLHYPEIFSDILLGASFLLIALFLIKIFTKVYK